MISSGDNGPPSGARDYQDNGPPAGPGIGHANGAGITAAGAAASSALGRQTKHPDRLRRARQKMSRLFGGLF